MVDYEPRNSNATLAISLQASGGERSGEDAEQKILANGSGLVFRLGGVKVWEGACSAV